MLLCLAPAARADAELTFDAIDGATLVTSQKPEAVSAMLDVFALEPDKTKYCALFHGLSDYFKKDYGTWTKEYEFEKDAIFTLNLVGILTRDEYNKAKDTLNYGAIVVHPHDGEAGVALSLIKENIDCS